MSESVGGGGGGSFRPNKERGVWSSSHDFAWACLNNAFRVDTMYWLSIVPMIVTYGFFSVISWFLIALLYVVPLFFIHSFLGQFSSSGYISALRISPLFKGLGYIGLAINLISMAFHSILVAVPLLFLLHSLHPPLPWSCDAPQPWNKTTWDFWDVHTSHCDLKYSPKDDTDYVRLSVSSLDFFQHKLTEFNLEVFGCVLVVWAALTYVIFQTSEKIGIFFRYCTIIMVTLLVIVFIRMLFLPGVLDHMGVSKSYRSKSWIFWIVQPLYITFTTFGAGWGSVLSLASYNKFTTNFVKYSWQIPICQFVILILLGLILNFAEVHLTQDYSAAIVKAKVLNLMAIPSSLASTEYPHLWTWMFLIMIILGSFNLTLTQVFSTQTALFDEFECLRPWRKKVILGGIAFLALSSAPFCTMNGLKIIASVFSATVFSQCFINLILIIALLWVYGHERLKRDVEFMTNELLANWKLNYIRFVSPTIFGLIAILAFLFGLQNYAPNIGSVIICVIFLPWIALVLYCVYRLSQVSGGCRLRFSRCTKPTDWYPVYPEDRQRYDEMFGIQETSPTLTTVA